MTTKQSRGTERGFVVRRIFLKKIGLSREWKSEEVTDGDSGESMAEDEVTGVGRGVRGGETVVRLSERNWELITETW